MKVTGLSNDVPLSSALFDSIVMRLSAELVCTAVSQYGVGGSEASGYASVYPWYACSRFLEVIDCLSLVLSSLAYPNAPLKMLGFVLRMAKKAI